VVVYVLAFLNSGKGERFAINMLAIHRINIMVPFTHPFLVFSRLQRNKMGSDEGRKQ